MLAPLTDDLIALSPEGTVFETDMSHLGHRERGQEQEWRPV
jgi:hypothetical protein